MTITLYCVLDISPLLDSDFRHKCPTLLSDVRHKCLIFCWCPTLDTGFQFRILVSDLEH